MYLDPEAIDNTFNVINQFAGEVSEVVLITSIHQF